MWNRRKAATRLYVTLSTGLGSDCSRWRGKTKPEIIRYFDRCEERLRLLNDLRLLWAILPTVEKRGEAWDNTMPWDTLVPEIEKRREIKIISYIRDLREPANRHYDTLSFYLLPDCSGYGKASWNKVIRQLEKHRENLT